MSVHTVELDVVFSNGDSGHTDDMTYPVELAEGQLAEEIAGLCAEVSRDTLVAFLKGLYQEPHDDGTPRGVAYEQLLRDFTQYGHQSLGWHDVMVSVAGIRIDGEVIEITEEQMDTDLNYELSLQLVRNAPEPPRMYLIG